MKNSFLTLIIGVLLSTTSMAQISQGDYVVGGSFGFNFYKAPNVLSNNYRYSFEVSPTFGRFIGETILLEGNLGYGYNHNRSNDGTTLTRVSTHNIVAGAELTKFFSISDNFYLTLGGGIYAGYGPSKTIFEFGGISTSNTSYTVSTGLAISPGLAFLISDNWMFYTKLGGLGYDMTYFEGSDQMSHRIGLNLDSSPFSLGVRYILK